MTAHVVYFAPTQVDRNGVKIDKNDPTVTMNKLKDTRMEQLVIPSADVPNSAGSPTIADYIKLEATSGFKIAHMTAGMIVTYNA